ncbi:MAG: hypothetical protein HKO12_04825, partial [Woeseiaceae bacterium]|nr:hypothetical protein [Woeseiaceae bacterium]
MNTKLTLFVGMSAGLLVGCGDDTADPQLSDAPAGGNTAGASSAIASPGGFWEGSDSDGGPINLLVTETGRFHLVDNDLNQGSGILNVSDTNDVDASFQFVTEPGSTFADSTTSTFCSLSGTLVERQSMTVTV